MRAHNRLGTIPNQKINWEENNIEVGMGGETSSEEHGVVRRRKKVRVGAEGGREGRESARARE